MSTYDADYYLRGKQTGKSLYENYRWLPHLTIPMCHTIIAHLGFQRQHTILDFGCARGYTVKALRQLGYDAYGQDCSTWAIENADDDTKPYLRLAEQVTHDFDWILAKDVLEHIPQVADTIANMQAYTRIGIFAVVPLSPADNEPYVLSDYERDVTHVHRLTLASWGRLFLRRGWEVRLSYRVPGIKDNHYVPAWEPGDGFITATRS